MSHSNLLHQLQLFRNSGQPPGHSSTVGDSVRPITMGGRRSPLTEAETSRVRRALFGPPDHAENLRFVQQELARGQREAAQKWNYDFVNDRPLQNGRYVWESTTGGTCIARQRLSSSQSLSPPIIGVSDVAECSGTDTTHLQSSKDFFGEIQKELSVDQSENIPSSHPNQGSGEKSEQQSHSVIVSEKKLSPSRPLPLICPSPNMTSYAFSSDKNCSRLVKSTISSSVSISAPATANVTPHDSPQAGSSNSGSKILPTSNSTKAETKLETATACDISTPASHGVLSAAVANLSHSTSKPTSSKTSTSTLCQRSRSQSLHRTQKLTGKI